MTKIKNALFGAFALALTLAPALASAQFSRTQGNAASSGLAGSSIYSIIQNTMNWLLAILGFLGIIGFVIAGILYLTAAGDEGRADSAKNAMFYSIFGIVVALIGFVILQAVDGWLRTSSAF